MAELPLEWPPKRFKDGFEFCKKHKLTDKFDKQLLEELDQKTRRRTTGSRKGSVTLQQYLVMLSVILEEEILEGRKEYKNLVNERKSDAIWDVTFTVFILMKKYDIIPDPII